MTLSRFCVSFFVNIVIQTPIMLLYYQMVLGKSYAIFDLPRICKNLVLFPIESLLLILFLNVITPLTYRMKLTYEPPKKLKITGRLVAFLLALLIVGSCATAGYAWYDYNTRNHATSLESDERAALNHKLADYLGVDDNTLVLVNVVTKTAFHDEETVTFTTYTITGEVDDPAVLWTLKNSVAKGEKYEGILTVGEKGTAVLNKADDSLVEIATEAPKETYTVNRHKTKLPGHLSGSLLYLRHCFYGARHPGLSLRGPNGAVAISCRQLRFRRWLPCCPAVFCEIATSLRSSQ